MRSLTVSAEGSAVPELNIVSRDVRNSRRGQLPRKPRGGESPFIQFLRSGVPAIPIVEDEYRPANAKRADAGFGEAETMSSR